MARVDATSLYGSWEKGVPDEQVSVVYTDGTFVLPKLYRIIMVATAGDVAVIQHNDQPAIIPALQPGIQYVFSAKAIIEAGTVAAGIVLQR